MSRATTAPGCLRFFLLCVVFVEWAGGLLVLFFNLGWPLGAVLLAVTLFSVPVLIPYWVVSQQVGFVLWGGPFVGLVLCFLLIGLAALFGSHSL